MSKLLLQILVIIICLFKSSLMANVKLPAIISDNMVLQQDSAVMLWGWANPDEEVSIKTGWGEDQLVVANKAGKWKCKVKTPKAGQIYDISFKGINEIKIDNVIIGELWLCSGQSNMAMPMSGWQKQPVLDGEKDIAESKNNSIRFFKVKNKKSDYLLDDVEGEWVECTPETVKEFSAVGYYFGREINEKTGYPVGLINSSWGGTLVQAWTRIECLSNDDNLSSVIRKYESCLDEWKKECEKADKDNKSKPVKKLPARDHDKPSVLYNGMIVPLTNMTIKGVIWYQGESNGGYAYQYRGLFPSLIKNWRCDFNNYDMPFYFVQLASFTKHTPGVPAKPYRGEPREHPWAELREAQLMATELCNTGMSVTIDIGETNSIHPANKRDVGKRLALWALAKDYDRDIECSGPLYQGYKIEGDQIRIFFSHVGSGLVFNDCEVKGFAIACKDRKFIWAEAKIDGETVVVYNPNVKNPVAVRYAWDIDPEISLYNKINLPASPFRTDGWNGVTYGKK